VSEQQLERAYQLIKEGREQDAFDILEPLLADNPDNADAWWLLANATDDLSSKERALEEVLRIGTNAEREAKAREMLNAVREIQNEMSDPIPESDTLPRQTNSQSAPRRKIRGVDDKRGKASSSENSGCGAARLVLVLVGGLTLVACMLCVGGLALFGPVVSEVATDIERSIEEAGGIENIEGAVEEFVGGFLNAPDEYDDMGEIDDGDTVTGAITSPDDRIGYTYEANPGDRIRVEIRALTGNIAPPVFLYGPNGELFDGTDGNIQSESDFSGDSISVFTTTLREEDDYLLIVRPIFGMAQNEYEMTLDVLNE
jgi:tetratricopeptide (TPR) repeat protein